MAETRLLMFSLLALGLSAQASLRAQVPPAGPYVLRPDPAAGAMPEAPHIDLDHSYNLPELIDLAESINPETRIAWNEARNAAASVGLAQGTFLPRLSATILGGYSASDGHDDALGLSASAHTHVSGTVSALSLEWLLFDFGERSAVVKATSARARFSDILFTAAHQKLIHAVSLAYYALQAAQARAAASDASYKDAQAIEQAASDRYRQGVGTVIEVAQAKQATAQAKLAQVQARGAAQDARLTLLAAIGIPPLTPIGIAPMPHRNLSSDLIEPVDDVIRAALARRPDIQAAYAAQQASLADVRAAEAARLPKAFVAASGSYASGDLALNAVPSVGDDPATLNLSGRHLGATIVGGIRIPIYDGGMRRTALVKARNLADSAAAALDRVKADAAQQIAAAQNQLATSLSAHDAATSLLSAAQTTYDAAFDAYRSGVSSATEMQLAERQLIEARTIATDSYYGALSAAATLALSTGELGSPPQ